MRPNIEVYIESKPETAAKEHNESSKYLFLLLRDSDMQRSDFAQIPIETLQNESFRCKMRCNNQCHSAKVVPTQVCFSLAINRFGLVLQPLRANVADQLHVLYHLFKPWRTRWATKLLVHMIKQQYFSSLSIFSDSCKLYFQPYSSTNTVGAKSVKMAAASCSLLSYVVHGDVSRRRKY